MKLLFAAADDEFDDTGAKLPFLAISEELAMRPVLLLLLLLLLPLLPAELTMLLVQLADAL